jgi:flagellar hook-associated protein 2
LGLRGRAVRRWHLGRDSDAEPDIAIVAGSRNDYRKQHPSTALLIVEVSDSTLRFDQGKLETALASDPNAAAQVFAGNGTAGGIANDLSTLVGQVRDGSIATHTKALDDQISSLQDQIDAGQRTVDAFETNLRQQFASLESLVSSLQSQGNFLSQALNKG